VQSIAEGDTPPLASEWMDWIKSTRVSLTFYRRQTMNFFSRFIFWVAPEHREAKLAYIMGAKTLTGFIRAVGPSKELIENAIDTILTEMGLNKETALRAIAKHWGMTITVTNAHCNNTLRK